MRRGCLLWKSAPAGGTPWKTSLARAPLPEDSYSVPGIEEVDAEANEVFDVARDERQAVFEGGGGDLAIGHIERPPRKLPLSLQDAPPLGNGSCDGQNATGKRDR